MNNIIENNGASGINCTWIWAGGKDISIKYNIIRNNGYSGIDNASDDVEISNNIIFSNADNGIRQLGSNLTLKQNNIYNNKFDFYNHSYKEIDAVGNYWGTNNTSLIDKLIYDFYDDMEQGIVNYQPIATEPFKAVDFLASSIYGQYPLHVSFINKSIGIITSAMWDFGDGETSNEINPVHIYKSAGTFNVILTVIGRNGEITETKSDYITVDTPNYTLSLSGSGNGSVKVNGTLHTLPWSGQFPSGADVQIEAMSDSGWSFSNWSGDLTGGSNPATVAMSVNKNITVNFSQNCDRSLTISINPPGSGIVTSNPDKATYCHDEQVTLTATPNTGYSFTSWSGVDSNSGTTAQVTMSNNKTVTANFSQIPIVNYTLSITKSGNGAVKVNGTSQILPWSGQFPSGTYVQIEAMPDNGWSFTNWTGDYTGSANPATINITGNKTVSANFSEICDKSLLINITPPESGTVTKNPDKANYCLSEIVQLTANQNEGYNFSSWGGVDSSNGLTASITMNDNRTVEANFNQQAANEPEINVSPVSRDFGNIKAGQSSALQNITISNTGSGDLMLGTHSITGDGAWAFNIQNDNCSGKTLKQSENCTLYVVFTPVTDGSFQANFEIPSNDTDEPVVTVDLIGGSGADLAGNWLF